MYCMYCVDCVEESQEVLSNRPTKPEVSTCGPRGASFARTPQRRVTTLAVERQKVARAPSDGARGASRAAHLLRDHPPRGLVPLPCPLREAPAGAPLGGPSGPVVVAIPVPVPVAAAVVVPVSVAAAVVVPVPVSVPVAATVVVPVVSIAGRALVRVVVTRAGVLPRRTAEAGLVVAAVGLPVAARGRVVDLRTVAAAAAAAARVELVWPQGVVARAPQRRMVGEGEGAAVEALDSEDKRLHVKKT
eukprot:813193-Pyramimonas_sp.AAC.1